MNRELMNVGKELMRIGEQLLKIAEGKSGGLVKSKLIKPTMSKGPMGAIELLKEESFFEQPRGIAEIMDKLKELGHYHRSSSILMNLLNLTKRREFTRIKEKGSKTWKYVIRK